MQESGMKRRVFFASLVAGAAALLAGLPILRTLLRKWGRAEGKSIVVTINPLAVPRGRKGGPHA
jgi:hypothetical protein